MPTDPLQQLRDALPADPDDHGPIAVPSDAIRAVVEAWESLLSVERLQAADITPDDTIVATLPRHATPDMLKVVADQLRDRFPGHEVLCVAGISLTVGRTNAGE